MYAPFFQSSHPLCCGTHYTVNFGLSLIFFEKVNNRHNYNTRLAVRESYGLPLVRTKYGQFSLRFIGVKVWNSLNENYKLLSKRSFKNAIQSDFVILYRYQSYLSSLL